MAEAKMMTKEFQAAIESFFNSPITVYEAGSEDSRPERIQDRPFVKTLPDGRSVYLQNTAKTEGKDGQFVMSLDKPVEGGSIEVETESSKFLSDIETRFRKVKPDANLIIIDPDVVRGRYAMDDSQRRSLLQSFATYLHGRMNDDGVAKAIPLEVDDYAQLMEASVTDNSPLSLSVPVKGKGQYAIVVSSQPDMPMHDMFTSIPGSEIRLDNEGLGKDDVRRMILYHELGHALDTKNRGQKGDTFSDGVLKRHLTECVADAHAVLQCARDTGSTKMGEIVGDVRIDNTVQGFAYILQKIRPNAAQQDAGDEMGDIFVDNLTPRKNYENQSFFASPELKEFIQKQKEVKAKAKQPNKEKNVNDEPTLEDILEGVKNNAQLFNVLKVLGSISSYSTTPTVDATVKIADEKLKDGSLQKMSDKEVHELAEKIVAKNAFNKEQLNGLVLGIVQGQNTPELIKLMKRGQEAESNFPEDQKAAQAQAMAAMGIPPQQPKLTTKEMSELITWRRELIEKVEVAGGDRKAIVDTVAKEKDVVRPQKDSLLAQYKTSIMNQEFITEAEKTSSKAMTLGTIRETLRVIESPKVEEKGAKLVASYINSEIKTIDAGEKGVALAKSRDIANLGPDAFGKAIASESKNLKKVLSSEKEAQTIAFAIRKDAEAWKIAQTSPALAARIEEKAKQKHPEWIEEVHLNLGSNDRFRLEMVNKMLAGNKKMLAHMTLSSQDVANAVGEKTTKKLASEMGTPQKKQAIAKETKKIVSEASPEDIQWNFIKGSLGKSK